VTDVDTLDEIEESTETNNGVRQTTLG